MIDDSNFTVGNSVIMLVDHQTGTVGWVKSLPRETVITGCRVLTRMALAYDMPLILTTTVEDQVGPTIPDISELAPTPMPSVTPEAASSTAGTTSVCATASPRSAARRSCWPGSPPTSACIGRRPAP